MTSQNVLVLLKQAQVEHGHITEADLTGIAQALDIPVSEVYGVATFYSFLTTRPRGRHVIRVCQSLPCHLKHSKETLASLKNEIGISPGGMTADGRFSLELTNCIGACDRAPAMLINDDLHGDLTPQKVSQILKSYQ